MNKHRKKERQNVEKKSLLKVPCSRFGFIRFVAVFKNDLNQFSNGFFPIEGCKGELRIILHNLLLSTENCISFQVTLALEDCINAVPGPA